MSKFNIDSNLCDAYSAFPGVDRRPLIGISGNYGDGECRLAEGYYKMIVAAGGSPVILPPLNSNAAMVNALNSLDGLLLSGGADYNPLFCGEEPIKGLGGINSERDLPELMLTRLAVNRQMPILGICRGIQTLAMALGGHVNQDIYSGHDGATIKHSQNADRSTPTHTVSLTEGSIIHEIYGEERIAVNSFHHQAVDDTGRMFRPTALSQDGVIEAMECTDHKPVIGVQWHPECMEEGLPLFRWLIDEAKLHRKTIETHNRIVTLDTHCDTPMLFADGVRLDQRDPRIKVDLHKMAEGHQDAAIMVAYLPQPKIGERFTDLVKFDVSGPTEYANLIFDKIEDFATRCRHHVSIARTPQDLYTDKRAGRRSIMLGIENCLALNGNIANVKHFAQRGVVYMTLCHNGDNEVCDSAKGSTTHNGVSRFGQRVIEEMNRHGIIVDLSHASEKSFYDALEMSSQPIVCSHSSCRALCNHPRNLTDDQLRALAAKGGVVQITLYPGFLKEEKKPIPSNNSTMSIFSKTSTTSPTPASLDDVIAHLEHAIRVCGIDHVGIGTDFDGDGGVPGINDSSEILNLTRQLLRRRYSETDIKKIWGGNFLRVMTEVQNVKVRP